MKKLTILSTLMLVMYLTSCVDDVFQHNTTASSDGNFVIRLATGTTTGTRASEGKQVGSDAENYINPEDCEFYFFDENGDRINEDKFELKYDGEKTEDGKIFHQFSGKILKEYEGKEIQLLVVANAETLLDDGYPNLTSISDLTTEIFKFNYNPETREEEGDTKNYSFKPNPVEGIGIPMSGVSQVPVTINSNEVNEFDVDMVRSLAKIEILNSSLYDEDSYRIYVEKNSSWTDVALYVWSNAKPLDDIQWPGRMPAGKKTINGTEYIYFEISKSHKGEKISLILNNNNRGYQIDGPQNFILNRDYYLELRGNIDNVQWYATKDFEHDGHTLYVKNNSAWDPLYLYGYNDGETAKIFGDWPGTSGGITLIDNEEYFFFDFGDSNSSLSQYFILHNNIGETSKIDIDLNGDGQPDDLQLNQDYFLELDYQEGFKQIGYTTYVWDNTGWLNTFLYTYGGGGILYGSYPGTQNTQMNKQPEGDKTYFSFPLIGSEITGQNQSLVFNDGLGKQLPDYNFDIKENLFLKIQENFPESEIKTDETHNTYRLYVLNESWWNSDDIHLHAWTDDNENLYGNWPGKSPDGTTTIGGNQYLYFDLGEVNNNKNINFILSNNGGARLTYPKTFTVNGNLFVKIPGYQYLESVSTEESYRVYIPKDYSGYSETALYVWGPGDILNGWPGTKGEGTILDGVSYLYWDIPKGYENQDLHLIFNDNSGDGGDGHQFDGPVLKISQNIILADNIENLDVSAVITTTSSYRRVYVKNQTVWDEPLYLYVWGEKNDATGPWPGKQADGKTDDDQYYFNRPSGIEGFSENLIFNRGTRAENGEWTTISQLPDFNFQVNGDLHITIQEGITTVDPSAIPHENKIYIEANGSDSYNNFYLDIDGESKSISERINSKEPTDVGGRKFYVIDLGNEVTPSIIINNGQTGEGEIIYLETDVNGEMYFSFNNEIKSITRLSDIEIPEAKSPDNITSIYLSTYKTSGLLVPETIVDNSQQFDKNWWTHQGYKTPNPSGETENKLYFVPGEEPGQWVCYVPECSVTEGLSLGFVIANADALGIKEIGDDGVKTVVINEGTSPLRSLLRNNLYQGSADIKKNLEIKYVVCPWNKKSSGDIEFE